MLNAVIRFSLHHRFLILGLALLVIVIGSIAGSKLPIDVLPKLTRPRVVLVTECHGLSPEEVEQQVTFPLENAINGAAGIVAVRTTSEIGLSVVTAEFDWGIDVFRARQIVQERISTSLEDLPDGIRPTMGPMSSLLGQILVIGMWSQNGVTDDLELRTLADWIVKPRLKNITGVSQVITMGGGRKQFHVLVDQHQMHQYDVGLNDIRGALLDSGRNASGGYVAQEDRELIIRGMARLQSIDDIKKVVVRSSKRRNVLVRDVARVVAHSQTKRGDSSVNGVPAVVITVQKQPGTRHESFDHRDQFGDGCHAGYTAARCPA